MKKSITISIIAILAIPSLAFASWWNPFSWGIWKHHSIEIAPKVEVEIRAASSTISATTSPKIIKKITVKKVEVKEPIATITQPQISTPLIVNATIAPAIPVTTTITPVTPLITQQITQAPMIEERATADISLTGSYPSNIDRQNNASLWNALLTINYGPITINSLTIRIIGSMSDSDLKNLKLYINGNQYGSTIENIGGDFKAKFESPIIINSGTTRIELIGDNVALSGRKFSFKLYENQTTDSFGTIRISGEARTPDQTVN